MLLQTGPVIVLLPIMDSNVRTGAWKMKAGACDRMARIIERSSKIWQINLKLEKCPPSVRDQLFLLLRGVRFGSRKIA